MAHDDLLFRHRRCFAALAASLLIGGCGSAPPVAVQALPSPLTFTWPTSIDLQQDGQLLVVENGSHRLVRVQPATGHVTEVAGGLAKPYAVAVAPNGATYISNARMLERSDSGGPLVAVAQAGEDIGPIAIAANGDVFYTTANSVFWLKGGTGAPQRLASKSKFHNPHGIGVAADGEILVCDTGSNRILRIDLKTGRVSTFIEMDQPRGLDVAADGTLYVVDAGTKRIEHLSADGTRRGFVGPMFNDPYDVEVAEDGVVYVIETAEVGTIRAIAPDGIASTISTAAPSR